VKTLWPYPAAALGEDEAALETALRQLGRPLGPRWRKEERETALAAWVALRLSLA
jgi:hypothetical protein